MDAFRIFPIIAFLFSLLVPAIAGPMDDAAAAFEKEDYERAIQVLRPLADQGDARAQYQLGAMYFNGRGVPRNYSESLKWFRLAAEQGDAASQFHAGMLYVSGPGLSHDSGEGLKWLQRAAEQGLAAAQYIVGLKHFAGDGAPKDVLAAYTWIYLAKAQKHQQAVEALTLVESVMSAAEIAEAQKIAGEWKPKKLP